ncbi:hypothetical protein [Spartinivicinus poritis]|uniref:Uncharacterized protein n=1 Tax=Spartinivicinus poritis TaxID=2994640 RepID=A0ABT5UC75_9GAMM|nr:hypothetical protein [Spartinivicinus sp. A2-2]MDE1463976.1 hypothetical protein [Spartinivicinus sp. A2-2]
MTEKPNNPNVDTTIKVGGASDTNYYEALYQIIQDAQAAGSVVQIVTIWPSTGYDESAFQKVMADDCQPSGSCPK